MSFSLAGGVGEIEAGGALLVGVDFEREPETVVGSAILALS
jgi:hypothetical protein